MDATAQTVIGIGVADPAAMIVAVRLAALPGAPEQGEGARHESEAFR